MLSSTKCLPPLAVGTSKSCGLRPAVRCGGPDGTRRSRGASEPRNAGDRTRDVGFGTLSRKEVAYWKHMQATSRSYRSTYQHQPSPLGQQVLSWLTLWCQQCHAGTPQRFVYLHTTAIRSHQNDLATQGSLPMRRAINGVVGVRCVPFVCMVLNIPPLYCMSW